MTLDSIKGGLISIAMGDAIGFVNELRIHKKYPYSFRLQYPIVIHNYYNNTYKTLAVGQYSDDTECVIILMRFLLSLSNNKDFKDNIDNLIFKYIKWANSTSIIGRNMRSLLKGIKTVNGYYSRINKLSKLELQNKCSNGAIMRCWPIAFTKNWKKNAKLDCYITNPNKLCYCVEILYLKMVRIAVLHNYNSIKSKYEIVKKIKTIANGECEFDFGCKFKNDSKTQIMNEILKYLDNDKCPIDPCGKYKSYVLITFWFAVKAFLNFDNFRDAIKWIVQDHHGSDTDTNAALFSGLFGSYYGFSKMSESKSFCKNVELLTNLDLTDDTKTDIPRKSKYLLLDFDELCEKFHKNAF